MPSLEQLKKYEWLIWLPALSVALMLRKDIGFRMLHRGYINGVAIVMYLISLFLQPQDKPKALAYFALLVFVMGFTQKFKRWREFRRRQKQHSCYIGTSPFEFAFIPAFFKRHRRMARFIDPLFCCLCGYALLPYASALGLWIMVSSGCLFVIESTVNKKLRERDMDMVDGLVYAEHQGDAVEQFEAAPLRPQRQSTAAVATGLGSDLEEKIRLRRANANNRRN